MSAWNDIRMPIGLTKWRAAWGRRRVLAGRRHRERTIMGWPERIEVRFDREV